MQHNNYEKAINHLISDHRKRLRLHLLDEINNNILYYRYFDFTESSCNYVEIQNFPKYKNIFSNNIYFSFKHTDDAQKFKFSNIFDRNSLYFVLKDYSNYLFDSKKDSLKNCQELFFYFNLPKRQSDFVKIKSWITLKNNLLISTKEKRVINFLRRYKEFIISGNKINSKRKFKFLNLENKINDRSRFFYYLGVKFQSIELINVLKSSDRLFLFEKKNEIDGNTYYIDYGYGTSYQIRFQLIALSQFKNGLNLNHKIQKDFLINPKYDFNNNTFNLCNGLNADSDFVWNKEQLKAIHLFKSNAPIFFLNGFVGTGKTEVLIHYIQNLKGKKTMVLAHDHDVVDFLQNKYKIYNDDTVQKNVFYRIGNSPKAKKSKNHINHKLDGLRNNIIQNATKYIEDPELNYDQQEIIRNWIEFLENEDFFESDELLGKLQLNSANAIFSTINGLEYYNKSGWLDIFLPFDYLIVDEASMTDISMIFHATQFCKSNIIAGDPFLVPPRTKEWKKRSNIIEDLESIYENSVNSIMISFNIEYRMNDVLFSLINKTIWKNPNAIRYLNGNYQISFQNTGNYLADSNIIFLNSDYCGKKSKDSHSINEWELNVISGLLKELNNRNNWNNLNKIHSINIWCTSLFNRQVNFLKSKLDLNNYPNLKLDICSVRSYTGDQAHVVIWSLVRTPYHPSKKKKPVIHLDALNNARYIYSLISRCISVLIIVGSKNVLENLANSLKKSKNSKFDKKIGEFIFHLINCKDVIFIEP